MPFITVNRARLYYRLEGNSSAPVLMFSHSIGCDHGMWEQQVEQLLPYFQILRYDTRGHGASEVTPGDYSIAMLAQDVLGMADALGIQQFAFCGLSLGGMIGQWLGAHAADRVTALVLANTSPLVAPASNWDTRKRMVLEGGMKAIVDLAMQRFFSAETLAQKNPHAMSVRSVLLGTDPAGYAGCCIAIRDMDYTTLLAQIRVPSLVIVGDKDVSTPWEGHGEVLAREIPGVRVVRLAAAHVSNIEKPRSFNQALVEFLHPASAATDPLNAGFEMRREVLGDGHVDRAIAGTNEFNREFQELITRYAWGTIWTRPGLDRRTRRVLVLAVAAALGRWEEFTLHVRAGLAHDLEPCDLKEVLLQVAIYAGVPAANTAFHIANDEMEKARASGATSSQ